MISGAGYGMAGTTKPRRPVWEIALAAVLLALGVEPKRPAPRVSSRGVSDRAPPKHRADADADAAPPCFAPDVSAYRRDNSLKNIALALYTRISEHRVVSIAAGVTFFALLAIFPTLAALVSIYGLFTDPG